VNRARNNKKNISEKNVIKQFISSRLPRTETGIKRGNKESAYLGMLLQSDVEVIISHVISI